MLKQLTLLAALAACPGHAETLSAELGRSGLAATEARLAAQIPLGDEDRLALGGVQFLRAIERSFQTRWAFGVTDRTNMFPFLRLPLTDNPAARPFEAPVIATLFREAEADLAKSITTLSEMPETSPAGLEIALSDLWFDINGNALRDPGEGLADVIGTTVLGLEVPQNGAPAPLPTIRFDAADAAWLSAYGHLLSGVAQVVLAYDPTEPIDRVLKARHKLAEWGTGPGDPFLGGDRVPDSFDMIAIILAALDQRPDVPRMAAAHTHFLAMISDNRRFWTLVDAETDNDREWLPNARQVSGLGLSLPPETKTLWLAVLDDAEALLKGEKLIPYWRTGDGGGINLNTVFTNPAPVDVAGWLQGWAAVPNMQTGPLVSPESWLQFENMMLGDAMLFAIWLN